MGEKKIELGSGTLYFHTPEGLRPLGKVEEIECFTEEPEIDILGRKPDIIIPQSREFTCSATVTHETMMGIVRAMELQILWANMCKHYPNKRVVYLATRHRHPLTRKKNAKRILCYYLKTVATDVHIRLGKKRNAVARQFLKYCEEVNI